MTPDYVGSEQSQHCENCGETTTHFMYHDSNWYCVDCGVRYD